jgi:SRSO17 transposase
MRPAARVMDKHLGMERVVGIEPAAWVASDELYGDNGAFRAGVAKLGLGYVLAVSCDHRIPAWPGGKPDCAPITSPPLAGRLLAPGQRRGRLQGCVLV